MHALLLGITRHHFRVMIGTKWDGQDNEVDTVLHNQMPKEVDLKKGCCLVASQSTTIKQLEMLRRPVHVERGKHATRESNRCVNHT